MAVPLKFWQTPMRATAERDASTSPDRLEGMWRRRRCDSDVPQARRWRFPFVAKRAPHESDLLMSSKSIWLSVRSGRVRNKKYRSGR